MKKNQLVLNRFLKIWISGLLFGLFLLPAVGFAQIKRVWALDDGEKIKKEDITNPLATDKNNAVWKYKLDQYFYWSTNFWGRINVFVNPFTFENRINGDGTFFYPGQDAQFPEESRNLAGPLSSIRMKNWRRGAQDLEYLWLAKNAGLENKMKTIVDNCVPTALWEAKGQKDVSWSGRGYKFDQYRKQLAELLSSASARQK